MVKKVSKKEKTTIKKKKGTTKKSKTTKKPKTKNVSKKSEKIDDLDIVFVDEDISVDKESELEARRAYLEESRSQESSGD